MARTAAKPVTDKIAADQEEKIILYDNLREIKEREKNKVNANISAHILKYVEQVNLKGDKEADKNITVLKLLPAWIASKNPVSREEYRELIEAKDPKTGYTLTKPGLQLLFKCLANSEADKHAQVLELRDKITNWLLQQHSTVPCFKCKVVQEGYSVPGPNIQCSLCSDNLCRICITNDDLKEFLKKA